MFVCLFASLGGGRKQDWEYVQGRLCSHLRLSESLVGCSTSHPLHHTTAQNQAGSHPESLHVSGKTASKRKLNLQEFKARGCLFGCLFWSQAGHLEVWRLAFWVEIPAQAPCTPSFPSQCVVSFPCSLLPGGHRRATVL